MLNGKQFQDIMLSRADASHGPKAPTASSPCLMLLPSCELQGSEGSVFTIIHSTVIFWHGLELRWNAIKLECADLLWTMQARTPDR